MSKVAFAGAALALAVAGAALAQPPAAPAPQIPAEAASLTWMAGCRAHTNANGSKIYEAFIGPVGGVVTGTAVFPMGNQTGTEYHKIGPGPDGSYGLSVANTRSNMQWNFTPLKAIEPGRISFATDAVTITYFSKPGNGMGALVERGGARTEYNFQPAC